MTEAYLDHTADENEMTMAGTLLYAAPEIILGTTTQTVKVDVYSFGIMLNQLDTRKKPYSINKYSKAYVLLPENPLRPRTRVNNVNAKDLKYINLAKACWNPKEYQRPTMLKVIHKFEAWIFRFGRRSPRRGLLF